MNIRNQIVKALYPICSDEVKILLDQMKEHPDRFYGKQGRFGMYEGEYEWEAVAAGHFGLIDSLAIKLKNKDIRIQLSKERILEQLLTSTSVPQEETPFTLQSLASSLTLTTGAAQPKKIVASQHQIDAIKAAQKKQVEYMKQQLDCATLASNPRGFRNKGKRGK